jgi:phosphoribosylformylglycinamidine (FGAM) synthase-like enzyme
MERKIIRKRADIKKRNSLSYKNKNLALILIKNSSDELGQSSFAKKLKRKN